jgi:hypothetical protein
MKITRVLFATDGAGSGHAKRIAAVVRQLDEKKSRTFKFECWAPNLVHSQYLPRKVIPVIDDEPLGDYELIFLDQRPSRIPRQIFSLSGLFVQLCKRVCEREVPDKIKDKTIQISIEDCKENQLAGMKYFGVLLDVDPLCIMNRADARRFIEKTVGKRIKVDEHLTLIQVNTSSPEAASIFIDSSLVEAGAESKVIVSSAHLEDGDLEFSNGIGHNIIYKGHFNNIVNICNAFDKIFAPSSYNTYYELGLYFHGQVIFKSIFDYEMPERLVASPEVSGSGNREITSFVLDQLDDYKR